MTNLMTGTLRTALAEVVDLIPRKLRTALYVAAVVVGALALAAQRLVPIWLPELDTRVDATCADVTAGALLLLGVLGTAYRPTRAQLLPVVPDALDIATAQEYRARTIETLINTGWPHAKAVAAVEADDFKLLTRPDDA